MQRRVLRGVLLAFALGGCSAGRQAQWDVAPQTTTTASGKSAQELVAQGDQAWQKRDDEPSVRAAIAAWEEAVSQNPNDSTTLAKLSRAYYFLADAHLRKKGDKSPEYLSAFEQGVAAGERALAAANPEFKKAVTSGAKVEDAIKSCGPECLDAMYWYAASLGKWSRAKGFATTLGNKDKVKAVMTRVQELGPEFFHGAADRYFGAFYAVAPGFAGGDMNKSREHFERSLKLAPSYAATKVLMAETWASKAQDRATFDRLLDEVLAMPEGTLPGFEPEIRVEKEKARELKAKASEIFD